MKLCLSMIVKNEANKIERCLASLAPYLDFWVIHDTGSSDGTVACIEKFFEGRGIPGHVTHGEFHNFEQARNEALAAARDADYPWDYIILCDADMELVVEDKNFRDQLKGASGYDLIQKAGTLSYHNRRFISRAATGKYIGVTHEYLDVAGGGCLTGVWYKDYADGSNRADKYRRDIRLLKIAIKKNPKDERSWYYLGQSYRDAGKPINAAGAYKRRIELGGWDEEVWSARVNYACCLRDSGDDAGFVREIIEAYNFRPSRAEALFELAKYYRLRGENFPALMVAEEGLKIARPNDILFVDDYVYSCGLLEEFSIIAFYDQKRRERGAAACNQLMLSPDSSGYTRELARSNMYHYIKPLCEYAPSFVTRRIAFTPPADYTPLNPSITATTDGIKCIVRSVNYTMDEQGRYLIKGTNGEANATNPIHTRNFLLALSPTFEVTAGTEVLPPEGLPPPAYNLVVGFEDMRLFAWRGSLWTSSTVREQNPEGWCEQTLARIDNGKLTDVTRMLPANRQHEKNWMPWVVNEQLRFVYQLGKTIDPATLAITSYTVPYDVGTLRGGTQVIDFHGSYLCLVHEARYRPDGIKRYYQHRFVLMNPASSTMKISKPFTFHDKVIEFAAGMAWHPDGRRIMISYGREDKEAWLATVDWHEITELLHG